MKLSDEDIKELVCDKSCVPQKAQQAIRQLMKERDRYRNIVNKLIMMEPEKECYTFVGNSGEYRLNLDTLEWEIAKQALGADDVENI